MKRTLWGTLLLLSLPILLPAQTSTASVSVTVNCNDGQSLNHTLSRLGKHVRNTVSVIGTCTEYVEVLGFDNLTLRGLQGASIVEPTTSGSGSPQGVLFIGASTSVTVSGFKVRSASITGVSAIAVGHGSRDIRLLNSQVSGGSAGIVVFENSQALVSHVTGQDAGYAVLAIFDSSDVHAEHCLFQDTTGTSWHSGLLIGAAHITMFDIIIRDFQVGIYAGTGSIVDTVAYTTYTPAGGPTDVLIDSPSGNTYNGVQLFSGSSLNLSSAKLLIHQTGQPWGGSTGGILVSGGSTLDSNGELAISGSLGQGIVVENNSHAGLSGDSITGSGHGGVVAVNASTVTVASGVGPALISGNGVDVFCDQSSMIAGGGNIAGASAIQCNNLSSGQTVLP